MRCSVTLHFGVNFRNKISTCAFDFQSKIVIASLIEFIFYTTYVYCPLHVYQEISFIVLYTWIFDPVTDLGLITAEFDV